MKKMITSDGKTVLLDNKDFKKFSYWKWHTINDYVSRMKRLSNGKWKRILLHREILNVPKGKETDHIDRNKLNNQRFNLRICTRRENNFNFPLRKDNKSGNAGLWWDDYLGKYQVHFGNKYLGLFKNKTEAIETYNNYRNLSY